MKIGFASQSVAKQQLEIENRLSYFLMRRLAIKPPMPRTESITIMLGSGTTLGVESRLTTRKPSMISMLAPPLSTAWQPMATIRQQTIRVPRT